ncbi:hypothetical protein V8E54_006838 [Elaphomyces granulatus]
MTAKRGVQPRVRKQSGSAAGPRRFRVSATPSGFQAFATQVAAASETGKEPVPTHASVDSRTTQNPIYLIYLWITDWLARAKSSLPRFAPVKMNLIYQQLSQRNREETPLWGNRRLASLPLPTILSYRIGFDSRIHDLSLVTDNNLPQVTSPPRTPKILDWGAYGDVLSGKPVWIYAQVPSGRIEERGSPRLPRSQ